MRNTHQNKLSGYSCKSGFLIMAHPGKTFSASLRRTAGWLIENALKALVVGGLIYYTYEEGLWSDAFKSSCYLGKFIEQCPPEESDDALMRNEFQDINNIVFDEPEPCQPFIPRSEVMLYTVVHAWNKTVVTFFWLILDAPFEMCHNFVKLFKPKPKPPPEVICTP